MTKEDVARRLISVLSQKLDLPEDELSKTQSLQDDLAVDSMTRLEIVMAIEEQFGIEIDPEEADQFQTIDDMITFLQKNSALTV